MERYNTRYSRDFEEKVLDYLIDKLNEFNYEGFTVYGCDLHNEIFNTDYVVIGRYEAKQRIAENIDDLFCMLDHYEEDFGENYQDIKSVERVLNLMYYMCGLELMSEIEYLQQDDNWNGVLDHKDIENILKEISNNEKE